MSDAPGNNGSAQSDWRPAAGTEILQARARLLALARRFFAQRQVMEIETPIVSTAATTDPAIESFQTQYRGPGRAGESPLYLQTSPELFMKRLLAAGSGPIYQFARVFRNAEYGTRHNPEFTLLEWYRTGFNYHQLMDEVEVLVKTLLGEALAGGDFERLSYRQLFTRFAGVDPFTAEPAVLQACLREHGQTVSVADSEPRRVWLDLVLTHVIEPQLQSGAWFVYDYPADQAALARVREDHPAVAERFELYVDGMELANGFQELTEVAEQRRRFERENQARVADKRAALPVDARFLDALASGMPDCAGVALGFDRLVMLATGRPRIADVMAFPFARI